MHQGQQKFYDYIMERVKEERTEEARSLLEEHFKKQAEGSFTHEDIMQFIPKMTELLMPDRVEEVKAVMTDFAAKHQ